MRFLRAATVLLCAFALAGPTVGRLTAQGLTRCFQPLANPRSHTTSDWNDLVRFAIPASTKLPADVVGVQRIKEDGFGAKINLDYYGITAAKHPTLPLAEFFLELRKQFPTFTAGGPDNQEFGPYRATNDFNDATRETNKKLWESPTPTLAVMTFVLKSTPTVIVGFSAVRIVGEQGDVIVGCSSPTDFIFSTVNSKNGEYHPVSGNRGFGIKDNGDSTWTFYSMGADREVKLADGTRKFANEYIAPRVVDASFKDEAVFALGHQFWLRFFPAVMDYMEKQKMKVVKDSYIINSQRYDYPLALPLNAEWIARWPVIPLQP